MDAVTTNRAKSLKGKFMNSFTTEQSIAKLLNDIMETSVISSAYKPGESIAVLLEHIVTVVLYNSHNKSYADKVENLWGPGWSVFLVMIAHRINPSVSSELIMSGVKETLRLMVGHSDITPFSAIASETDIPHDEVGSSSILVIYEMPCYVDMATEICNDLGIPSPEEMLYMFHALGYESALEASQLYNMKTPDGKPITEHNAHDMATLMRAKRAVKEAATQTEEVVKQIKHTTSCSCEEATKTALAIENAVNASIRAERSLVLAESGISTPDRNSVPEELDINWILNNFPTCVCDVGVTTASAVKDTIMHVLGIVCISGLVLWAHILIERNS